MVDQIDRNVATWMSEQREIRQLSQDAVAIQLSMDQPTVSKIERGLRRVSVSEFVSWCDALGVSNEQVCKLMASLRTYGGGSYPSGAGE